MVSTGLKGTDLSIKHLAETFYFVLFFLLKPNQKIWRTLLKALNVELSTKPVLTIAIVGSSFYCSFFSVRTGDEEKSSHSIGLLFNLDNIDI